MFVVVLDVGEEEEPEGLKLVHELGDYGLFRLLHVDGGEIIVVQFERDLDDVVLILHNSDFKDKIQFKIIHSI